MFEFNVGSINVKIFRTRHVTTSKTSLRNSQLSYGVLIDDRVLFTGDTQFNEFQLRWLLDKYKGIYVGQATKSIKKRLIEHYRKPSSSFDCTYMPYHVTKVYVLRCLATDILDYLERDLIACVGKEITLNSSIGGHDLLLFTNDKEYNPENFKLTDNQLKKLPL